MGSGALSGKPAAMFVSTGGAGGGQERHHQECHVVFGSPWYAIYSF